MKIVQIGCSGHFYGSFYGALKNRSDLQLVAFAKGLEDEECDDFVENHKDRFGFKVYDNYIEMLEEVKPDIAVVNSIFYANAKICVEVFKRGVSCYSEKPSATTLEDLYLLRDEYKKHNVHYVTMLEARAHAPFWTTYNYVREGNIGEVIMVTAQKSYKLGERDDFFKSRKLFGGTIPWVGIHPFDWIRWISGKEIVSANARHLAAHNGIYTELETAAICMFEFEGGGFASASLDYMRPESAKTHGDDRIRFVGDKGIVEIRNDKVFAMDEKGDREIELKYTRNPFEAFADQVAGKGAGLASAEESFRVTEICLCARQSADEKRIIQIPVND